jgi:hypothetical protein
MRRRPTTLYGVRDFCLLDCHTDAVPKLLREFLNNDEIMF